MHTFIFCMFFLIFFIIQIKESKIEHSTNKPLCRCSMPPSARCHSGRLPMSPIPEFTTGHGLGAGDHEGHMISIIFILNKSLCPVDGGGVILKKATTIQIKKWLCPQVKYISWCWWYGAERLELVKKLLREMTSIRDRGKGDFWHTQNENCITVERKMACWETARARNVCAREKQSHRTTAWQG